MKRIFLSLVLAALAGGFVPLHAAEQPSPAETRLREALRNSMLQLRDAQNQIATLQAAQAESDQQKAGLKTQLDDTGKKLETMIKQSAADKAQADKSLAELNAKLDQRQQQVEQLNLALKKWKEGYTQVLNIAKTKESERSQLAAECIVLQRKVEDRERKNAELFKAGNEILTRYEKFSLGEAITAKEPFVGTTRVKLETLVQDYQDKLLENRVIAGEDLPPAKEKPLASSGPSVAGSDTRSGSAP